MVNSLSNVNLYKVDAYSYGMVLFQMVSLKISWELGGLVKS